MYVGTAKGQIYVTQDGGGTQGSNNWLNVSTGLDGSPVKSIITNPNRGSHQAYAVTQQGMYVIADSVPSASNPTPTWVNITGNILSLPYTIDGQNYNPKLTPTRSRTIMRPRSRPSWPIGNTPSPTIPPISVQGITLCSMSAPIRAYMSINNGKSWSAFPDTTFGAVGRWKSASRECLEPELVVGQYRHQYRHAESGWTV